MTIKINDKNYTIKYTIRALFIFEQITGKSFEIKTLLDNYIFFYCMILANNEEPLDWDEFIDAIDNDANLMNQLSKIITDSQKKENIFGSDDSSGEKKS